MTMFDEEWRNYYHTILDQILDIVERNSPDNDRRKKSTPNTFEEYIDEVDRDTTHTYRLLMLFRELAALAEDHVGALRENLHQHYDFTKFTEKERRVLSKLRKLKYKKNLEFKKYYELYPSREKIYNILTDKIYSTENTRNFMAFCIENRLPLHIPDATDLSKALRSLNDGQTTHLLHSASTRKWRTNTTAIKQLKFLAICQIFILMGNNKKLKKFEAIEIVAKYYGCSCETVKQWEKRDVPLNYPKEFLKNIQPLLTKVGSNGFITYDEDISYLKEFIEHKVNFENEPMEFLVQFFMNPAGNTIVRCKEKYQKALRATEEDYSVTVSGYHEMMRCLYILTNTQRRALVMLDEMINDYI